MPRFTSAPISFSTRIVPEWRNGRRRGLKILRRKARILNDKPTAYETGIGGWRVIDGKRYPITGSITVSRDCFRGQYHDLRDTHKRLGGRLAA